MNKKQLQDKAVDIKGKKYVLVADRILYFNETYPEGSITTELLTPYDSDLIIIKATVEVNSAPNHDSICRISKHLRGETAIGSHLPECNCGAKQVIRKFTGHSQARVGDGYINKTSALENAETSAVGRALAMMGIGVIDSIASVDEINKTTHYQKSTENNNVEKFMEDLQLSEEDLIKYDELLESSMDLKTLKSNWSKLPPLAQDKLAKKKDALKSQLG